MLRRPDKLRRLRLDRDEPVEKPKPPERGLGAKLLRGEDVRLLGLMFDGRYVGIGLILVILTAGLGYWWMYNRSFYQEYATDTVEIAGNPYRVDRFRGIQSTGDDRMVHACFLIDGRILAPPADNPVPPPAPAWLKCYKADYIAQELAEGIAKAYLAEHNSPPGYDRVVAVSSGGRGFMWRQPNGLPTE